MVIATIVRLCPADVVFGNVTEPWDLQFLDHTEGDGQHALVFADNGRAFGISDDIELAHDKLRTAQPFAARIISLQAIFRRLADLIHRQAAAKAPAIQQSPHEPEWRGIIRFALYVREIG